MSAEKTIHVVAFDVPFPPDYGGVTDVYFRCRALKRAGFRVLLHCFEYGRGRKHDYTEIADEVFYYSRRKSVMDLFATLPFIVKTRGSGQLLQRLAQTDAPIIFEGQHTTFFLEHPDLAKRRKLVRLHNIEWQYYAGLTQCAQSAFKKWFFRSESVKLQRHERVLKAASVLGCISYSDLDYYDDRFSNAVYLPVSFELYPEPEEPLDRLPFVLFHGNLSVEENYEGALWVLKAFERYKGEKQLIIAGKDPDASLIKACKNRKNVMLIADPDRKLMAQLIQSADAHLLVSFQHSGIKLKLLNALMSGKPCIVTPLMVPGTGVEHFCTIIETPEQLMTAVENTPPVSETEKTDRIQRLRELFSEENLITLVKERLF